MSSVFTFADERARDEYRRHPAHRALLDLAGPVVEELLVFDYWAEDSAGAD